MGSTLLALNVLGDGLRDALDPKLRGSRPDVALLEVEDLLERALRHLETHGNQSPPSTA